MDWAVAAGPIHPTIFPIAIPFLPSIHWGENYINVKDFMTNVLFPVRILLSRLIRTQ